ncbi:MAG: SRPBCC domain-containing protein [Crocinitomicaceae bacterium]|nr:SRPBCC domain-containing protein [Crocinitomicaceae bacterium]
MKEKLELKEIFNATPSEIYAAWLNGETHTIMTGGEAKCSNKEGGSFSAWDGYITGTNVSLTKDEKIVQTWRTSDFALTDEASLVTITLSKISNRTELRIIHTNIPEGQTQYKQGWIDHYFIPMKDFFE